MGIRTPFDIMGTLGNYKYFPFIFKVNTTLNPNNSSDKTFIVPFTAGTYSILSGKPVGINWGDGNYTIINDGVFTQANCTHTYSTAGTYKIAIISAGYYAPFLSFYSNYASINSNSLKLIETQTGIIPPITTAGVEITNVENVFKNCTNLKTITYELFKNLTNLSTNAFYHTFENCTSLTDIPLYLFRYAPNVTSHAFDHTFYNCTSIINLPAILFKFNTEASDYAFYGTFEGCTGLTSLPYTLFTYATKTTNNAFDRTFANCINITSIPDNFFETTTSYSYAETFSGCTKLAINPCLFGNYDTDPAIKTKRFNNNIQYNFTKMFYRTEFLTTGSAGTAPDIWNWTYQQTPISDNCFGGLGNTSLTNYKKVPTNWGGPERYTLTITPTPSTATVILDAGSEYTQSGNSISVHYGTSVHYTVSESYYDTKSGDITVTGNTTLAVTLDKTLYTYSITANPADATIVLTSSDPAYTQSGNSISVPYNTVVTYTVSHAHYISTSGSYTVTGTYSQSITLTKEQYSITIIATPSDSTVTINGTTRTSATFDYNTLVSWSVAKYGYTTQANEFLIDSNTSLTITLEIKRVTLTIIPTPSDATVIINGEERKTITVNQGTTITYSVSKDGYFTETDTFVLDENADIDIDLEKIYTYSFTTDPEESTMILTVDGETVQGKSIQGAEGDVLEWQATATDKVQKSGSFTIVAADITTPITLYPKTVSYQINPTPIDSKVTITPETHITNTAYTQKDYIEFNGAQYLDTGYKPNNNTRITANVMFTDDSVTTRYAFGAKNSMYCCGKEVNGTEPYVFLRYGEGTTTDCVTYPIKEAINTLYKLDANKNSLCVSNFYNVSTNTTGILQNNTFTSSDSLLIGAARQSDGSAIYGLIGRIYSLTIYDAGTLTKNYLPCIRNSDSVAGLYDTVNNTFIASSSTTAVSANNILPDAYQPVEYLESNGTQYIDTGIISTPTTDFEIAAIPTDSSGTGAFIGADSNSSSRKSGIFQDGTTATIWQGGDGNGGRITVGTAFVWALIGSAVYMDGTNWGTLDRVTGKVPLILFASQTSSNVINNYLTGRIKYCKLWSSNTLVRNYIACYRKSDSVAGLYDTVQGVFYTNAGTGTFTCGDKITTDNIKYVESGSSLSWNVTHNGCQPASGTATPSEDTINNVTLVENGYIIADDYTYTEDEEGVTILKYIGTGTDITAPYLQGGSS